MYSMAAVDFAYYHREFLVKFLASVEGLSDTQQTSLMQNYKTVEVCSEASVLVRRVDSF